jgi:phospholipid-binding lipoprotein MlaA
MAAVMALVAGAPAAADDADAPGRGDGARLQLAQAAEPQLAEPNDDINDPLEPVNRIVFTFNEGVQDALLRPLAYTYNDVFPVTFRTGVRNFLVYLATPVTLANDLLQFEITRAMQTVSRFMVNTVGLVGIADLASELGMEGHQEDFGQTLAVWGVGEGFYLVLPLLGPSNPRDAVGKYVVDSYFDPLGLYLDNTDQDGLLYSRLLVDGFTQYAGLVRELDEIKKTSVDYYAALRSLYRQKRQAEIANGSPQSLPSIPDYDINLEPDVRSEPVAVAPAQ